jgi:hypothetical protein
MMKIGHFLPDEEWGPAIENSTRRAHERLTLKILLIPGLFAHQHQPGMGRAFADDGLRGAFPEIAGAAFLEVLAEP